MDQKYNVSITIKNNISYSRNYNKDGAYARKLCGEFNGTPFAFGPDGELSFLAHADHNEVKGRFEHRGVEITHGSDGVLRVIYDMRSNAPLIMDGKEQFIHECIQPPLCTPVLNCPSRF